MNKLLDFLNAELRHHRSVIVNTTENQNGVELAPSSESIDAAMIQHATTQTDETETPDITALKSALTMLEEKVAYLENEVIPQLRVAIHQFIPPAQRT